MKGLFTMRSHLMIWNVKDDTHASAWSELRMRDLFAKVSTLGVHCDVSSPYREQLCLRAYVLGLGWLWRISTLRAASAICVGGALSYCWTAWYLYHRTPPAAEYQCAAANCVAHVKSKTLCPDNTSSSRSTTSVSVVLALCFPAWLASFLKSVSQVLLVRLWTSQQSPLCWRTGLAQPSSTISWGLQALHECKQHRFGSSNRSEYIIRYSMYVVDTQSLPTEVILFILQSWTDIEKLSVEDFQHLRNLRKPLTASETILPRVHDSSLFWKSPNFWVSSPQKFVRLAFKSETST